LIALSVAGLYALVVLYVYGIFCLQLSGRIFGFKDQHPDFYLVPILGLCLLSPILSIVSIFSNIGPLVDLLVLIGAVVIGFAYRRTIFALLRKYLSKMSLPRGLVLFVLLNCFFILYLSILPLQSGDSVGTHAQQVKWIEEYRAVPGLGNLHGRFATDSSWFILQALFSFSFAKGQPFHVLNGLLFLIAVVISASGLKTLLARDFRFSVIVKALFFVPLVYFQADNISSFSPNLPVCVIAWIVLIVLLEKIEKTTTRVFDLDSFIIVLLSSYVLTIKLSAFPIGILVLYVFIFELSKGQRTNALKTIITPCIFLLPVFVRSVILSGYLVYPFPALDIFNVDWKIPPPRALAEQQWITSWAINPGKDPAEILGKGFLSWVPMWWENQSFVEKALLCIIVIMPCSYILYFKVKKKSLFLVLNRYKEYVLIVALYSLAVLSLFFTAPSFRFGTGFIVSLALFYLAPLMQLLLVRSSEKAAYVSSVIVFSACTGMFFAYMVLRTSAPYLVEVKEFENSLLSRAYPNDKSFIQSLYKKDDSGMYYERQLVPGAKTSLALAKVLLRSRNIKLLSQLESGLLFPIGYPDNHVSRHELNNFYYYSPARPGEIWYAPLPAANYPPGDPDVMNFPSKDLELRGKDLQDGFRIGHHTGSPPGTG
jgi:hypothetical protein